MPDTYQGTELWDFSLVDPDNRRPVDYARRRAVLGGLKQQIGAAGGRRELATDAARTMEDGRVKLLVTWLALECRRENLGLFSAGEYVPVEVSGTHRDHVFAFARRHAGKWAVVAVPRLTVRLVPAGGLPVGAGRVEGHEDPPPLAGVRRRFAKRLYRHKARRTRGWRCIRSRRFRRLPRGAMAVGEIGGKWSARDGPAGVVTPGDNGIGDRRMSFYETV